ncbi:zinc-ribbon domain-containing protein [Ruminococcus sp. YE71]|uniref:zinc ribbon domain-containing protein n=1 Tax=unclassified Ruminococcus TaxID=2608920 RepID=UPI00088AC100|nr:MULTISPECIES: zinc ribbon domain-containing protein [unclassified Ruminococcus]SDA24839.1 zinc-ribbon domain-containing protein [Ruminococcus sp. YE78]SFW43402.1 zinc-ribbon domain-containing protein [Ruminococcus sp. YE71]
MICPNCGKQINDGDLFCAYCRQRVDSQPVQQTIQPVYVQPEQPIRSTDPVKEQHPASVFFTTLFIGASLIASFIMFIKPGYMLGRDDDDSSSRKKKSDSSVSVVDKESKEDDSEIVTTVTTAGTTKKSTTSDDSDGITTTKTTTTAADTSAATTKKTTTKKSTTTKTTTSQNTTSITAANTTTAAPVTDQPTTTAATKSADDIAKEDAVNYSTDEKPSFSDFEWCYGQFGLVRDPPSDVEFLMESGSWTGGWKCMIVYSTSENDEQYIREINNVYIDIEGTDIDMTVKHYIYEIDGESYDDSITANWTLTGQVTNGPFEVVGGERVTMRSFWRQNGHEYAVGDMMLQDGTDAYIAFYR